MALSKSQTKPLKVRSLKRIKLDMTNKANSRCCRKSQQRAQWLFSQSEKSLICGIAPILKNQAKPQSHLLETGQYTVNSITTRNPRSATLGIAAGTALERLLTNPIHFVVATHLTLHNDMAILRRRRLLQNHSDEHRIRRQRVCHDFSIFLLL